MPAAFYLRAPGEYVRPPRTFRLDGACDEYARWVPAAGLTFHQEALARLRDGQVDVELVPEPGNPHDNRAVALDVDGRRCGYLYADSAAWYHDVVRAQNRSGSAVVAAGRVRRAQRTDGGAGLVVVLEWQRPGLQDLVDLAEAAGLREAHDRAWSQLTESERAQALEDCWGEFSRGTCKALRARAHLAPELTWSSSRSLELPERVPAWHYGFAREEVLEERERAREERARERAVRQAAKAAEKQLADEARSARAEQRRAVEGTAMELYRAGGMTHAQIAAETGLPKSAVERLARTVRSEEGLEANRWNDEAVAGRDCPASSRWQVLGLGEVDAAL